MHILKTYRKTFFLVLTLIFAVGCKEAKEKTTSDEPKKEATAQAITEERVYIQKLTPEQQIASAVLAAPKESREGAKVYGYDDKNNFITLREGTNNMICIADNPEKKGFEVVSYHKDIEPFMARGRALKAEGKSSSEKREIREREAKEGTLAMPKSPVTLHILFGKNGRFNIETGKIEGAHYRYVVYVPFATPESTGLGVSPNAPGHPWLMYPGKAGAHIMISPPISEKK